MLYDRISDRYFEAHVTTEPATGERFEQWHQICQDFGFRPATLLMRKPSGEITGEHIDDQFCTAREKSYNTIFAMTQDLVAELKARGFRVHRAKIEDTLYDTKIDGWKGLEE